VTNPSTGPEWVKYTRADDLTRAMTRCHCNGKGYVTFPFPSGHPLQYKAIRCYCLEQQLQLARAKKLREESGLTEEVLAKWTFESWHPEYIATSDKDQIERARRIKELCMTYAQKPTRWLTLTGKTGTGKTHLACAITSALLARNIPAYMVKVADLVDQLRATNSEKAKRTELELIDWCKMVRVLILDDLAAQRVTAYSNEKLLQITDWRYMNDLPTVFTTNLHIRGADQSMILDGIDLDIRILSRLQEGLILTCNWEDWRTNLHGPQARMLK